VPHCIRPFGQMPFSQAGNGLEGTLHAFGGWPELDGIGELERDERRGQQN